MATKKIKPAFKKIQGGWEWAPHKNAPVFFVTEHKAPFGAYYKMQMALPAALGGGSLIATNQKSKKEMWFSRAGDILDIWRSGVFDMSNRSDFPEAWRPVTAANPMNDFEQFFYDNDLKLTCKQVATRPGSADWSGGSTHWKCTLRQWKNSMTFYYSMGSAHTGQPSTDDVLNSLALDAQTFENTRDYHDLAEEFGMSASEAKKLYAAVAKNAEGLKRVLGRHYNELLALEPL